MPCKKAEDIGTARPLLIADIQQSHRVINHFHVNSETNAIVLKIYKTDTRPLCRMNII